MQPFTNPNPKRKRGDESVGVAPCLRFGLRRVISEGSSSFILLLALSICGTVHATEEISIPNALLTVVESAEVSAARGGTLEKLLVREGELVKSGELVAQLKSQQAQLAVEESRLELKMAQQTADNDVDIRYARKTLQQAENEFERSVSVNEALPGTIPEREVDFLRLAVERSKLEIERAEKAHELSTTKVALQESAVKMAELELAQHRSEAPIDGMVVSIEKRVGEWIEPGDSLVRIVRIDRIRAEGFLKAPQAKIGLIGRSAELTVEVPGGKTIQVSGKVTFVSPEANPVNGMVRIWAEFNRAKTALRPGLSGTVQIHPRKKHE